MSTSDDDPPEPAARDHVLEQADAAHERAVRKLQDDTRLADRFHDLDHGSKDILFYRIEKKNTLRGARATSPGLGPERKHEPAPLDPPTPRPVEIDARPAPERVGTGRAGHAPSSDSAPPLSHRRKRRSQIVAASVFGLLSLSMGAALFVLRQPGPTDATQTASTQPTVATALSPATSASAVRPTSNAPTPQPTGEPTSPATTAMPHVPAPPPQTATPTSTEAAESHPPPRPRSSSHGTPPEPKSAEPLAPPQDPPRPPPAAPSTPAGKTPQWQAP